MKLPPFFICVDERENARFSKQERFSTTLSRSNIFFTLNFERRRNKTFDAKVPLRDSCFCSCTLNHALKNSNLQNSREASFYEHISMKIREYSDAYVFFDFPLYFTDNASAYGPLEFINLKSNRL